MSDPKDAYWFKHDSNASNDPDIVFMRSEHGWKGYGLFWAIVERLRDMADYRFPHARIPALAYDLREDDIETFITACIDRYGLFESDGEFFWSTSLNRRMEQRDAEKARRKEMAAAAANARWGNEQCDGNADASPEYPPTDADAMPTHSERNADAMPEQCGRNADAMQVQCGTMLEEEKREEEKTEEDIIKDTHKENAREVEPAGHSEVLVGKQSIEDVVYWAFEQENGSPFAKPDLQRKKVLELIELARVRGDPGQLLPAMLATFRRLKQTDSFYEKQPSTPAVMVPLWEKIFEHLKNGKKKSVPEYQARAPDPDAKTLEIEEGGMMKTVREKALGGNI